jgi:hypothetical protein
MRHTRADAGFVCTDLSNAEQLRDARHVYQRLDGRPITVPELQQQISAARNDARSAVILR